VACADSRVPPAGPAGRACERRAGRPFSLGWLPLLAALALPAAAADRPGDEIYRGACIVCHDSGRHEAPRLGDRAAWAPRAVRGMDELVPSAMNGVGKMPRMGANPALSDGELAGAVRYLLAAAGFPQAEPSPEALRRWREVADRRRAERSAAAP